VNDDANHPRLEQRLRESLHSALTVANDVRVDRGTYACNIHLSRPPAICFQEGIELETVAYVAMLETNVYLMPDAKYAHDELVFGLSECGWDVIKSKDTQ